MNVAIFGGTGFVGKYILNSLIQNNHNVHALVRFNSKHKIQNINNINIIYGEVTNNTSLDQTIMNCSSIIYNIGIIREFPNKGITYQKLHYDYVVKIIDKAKQYNIKHFILMSANGVSPYGTDYQRTKYLAEEYLKKSGLNYTIFKPSLIFGKPDRDQEFCSQLRDTMIRLPIPAPLFFKGFNLLSSGKFQMTPIHVENVADFFVKAVLNEKHYMKSYNLGGVQSFTWKEIITYIASALKKKKWIFPTPVLPIKILAFLFDRFNFFPITRDQITMLLEGNTCDSKILFNQFEIKPITFSINNLSYLSEK